MDNREKIEAKIQEGKFQEAMNMAILDAMTLQISTSSKDQPDQEFRTTIDLLENEIENQLGDSSLEKFHFSQVQKTQDMMMNNITSLQKMFTLLQESSNQL